MRKLVITLLLMISLKGIAQQEAQYSNYQMNNFILNPAVAGSYSYLNAKVGIRQQWVGIEGAPRTMFGTFHTPIHHPNATPKVRHKYAHHGVGLSVYSDETGAFKNQSLLGTYAYHTKIGQGYTFSVGTSSGIKMFTIDPNQIEFVQTLNDQNVGGSVVSKITPDVNIGVWLYSDRLFAGISGRQLLNTDVSLKPEVNTNGGQKLLQHYFTTIGYMLDINPDWHFIPSVMAQITNSSPTQIDLNGTFWYQKQFALGFSYRHLDAVYLILDYVYNDSLEVGYAYDLNISDLRSFNSGSHEIIVGYRWGNLSNKINCPGNFW